MFSRRHSQLHGDRRGQAAGWVKPGWVARKGSWSSPGAQGLRAGAAAHVDAGPWGSRRTHLEVSLGEGSNCESGLPLHAQIVTSVLPGGGRQLDDGRQRGTYVPTRLRLSVCGGCCVCFLSSSSSSSLDRSSGSPGTLCRLCFLLSSRSRHRWGPRPADSRGRSGSASRCASLSVCPAPGRHPPGGRQCLCTAR